MLLRVVVYFCFVWAFGDGQKTLDHNEVCKEYARHVYGKNQELLGSNDLDTCALAEPVFTEAKEAAPREYPHLALIGYGEKKSVEWLCGGSLISDQFVLTSSHCTTTVIGLARWVRLGEYNVVSKQDDEGRLAQPIDYEVVERFNHPDYHPPSVYHDIALFKLGRRVQFNEYIRPACLHTGDHFHHVIAAGWGNTEWGGYQNDVLQKANLTITPIDQCRSAYRTAIGPKLSKGILEIFQFCAGDPITGGDICHSDSGGPVQVPLKNPYCMYSQVGITSFGAKCGGNKPGVYTRVAPYMPWIEKTVWS